MTTDATDFVATVRSAPPVLPSEIALIVALPRPTAVTTPNELTVAIAGFELCHATARPVSVVPSASVSVAFALVTWPTSSVPVSSDTNTDDTGRP